MGDPKRVKGAEFVSLGNRKPPTSAAADLGIETCSAAEFIRLWAEQKGVRWVTLPYTSIRWDTDEKMPL